jgi:hypothetical protein
VVHSWLVTRQREDVMQLVLAVIQNSG